MAEEATKDKKQKEVVKALLIDVRSKEEFDEGAAKGAINIPHNQIAKEIGKHAKSKSHPLILYWRSGGRARVAQKALEKLGYTNITNLKTLEKAQEHVKKESEKNK